MHFHFYIRHGCWLLFKKELNLRNKQQALILYFDRVSRLNKFKSLGRNEAFLVKLMQDNEQLVQDSLKELAKFGIDGKQYLETTKGIIDFNLHCEERDLLEKLIERCGKCKNYICTDSSAITTTCPNNDFINHGYPITCSYFNDSNKIFAERLEDGILRCKKCTHFKKKCLLQKNILDTTCESVK